MANNNQEQNEYWNGPAGQRWVAYQEDFDRVIGVFGEAALARLPLAPGARVLEVGCGSGTILLDLAQRIAPGGTLVGVDISRPLVERARERVPARAAELRVALEVLLGDAASYRAKSPFDILFSRFGVMFFDDPVAAFANLRGALAPEGHLGFVCWRALAENVWSSLPLRAARRVLPAPAQSPDPRAPGPFAFAERDYVHGILRQAGFSQIELAPFDAAVPLSTTGLEGAIEQALRIGPTSRLLADQPEEVVARVREEVRRELEPLIEGDRVDLTGAVWLVTARAP
jgi:SAM-dependent methyltransferase